MDKLKVLQVNKLYSPWIGGIESVAKMVGEELNNKTDMQVLVCQPKGKGSKELVNGVRVTRAGSFGILFSMPISLSFPFLVRKYSKKADVIVLHDPFPLGDLAILLSGFKGKVVVWWHSDIIKQKKLLKLINPIIHGILKRADAIFTTTEGYIEGSVYISKYREKCRLVPYGIDTKAYLKADLKPILTKELLFPESKKILFVGRLIYYKGVSILIEAFKKVQNAELFIVGTGSDEESLRAEASCIGEKIHFMGNLSDVDLKSAFSDCDVFVLPSIEKSEAFGIVQLEAMVYGKPVINTDLNTSVPYVSLDGQTGITIKTGDVCELADAMNCLISDNELRRKYGTNAANRVLSTFDKDMMIENIYNQFKKLTEEQT